MSHDNFHLKTAAKTRILPPLKRAIARLGERNPTFTEVFMSRSFGFISPVGVVAAVIAAATTFLLVCVSMSTVWFAGIAGA